MNMKTVMLSLSASLAASSLAIAQAPPPYPQPPINVPAAPQVQAVPVPGQPPVVVQQPPVFVPGVPVVPVQTALTIAQAERALKCLPPGCHHVMFIHPVTKFPVSVTIRLSGCPTDVKCGKLLGTYRLTFKIKGLCNDVVVKFKPNGTAVVAD
jgi:hypothetical protein